MDIEMQNKGKSSTKEQKISAEKEQAFSTTKLFIGGLLINAMILYSLPSMTA